MKSHFIPYAFLVIAVFICWEAFSQPKWKYSPISQTVSKVYYKTSIPYGTKFNTIIRKIGGGQRWVSYKMGSSVPSNELIVDIDMSFNNVGYAISSTGILLKTTDGGEINWTPIYQFPVECKQIVAVNDTIAYAIQRYYGIIYKTEDGGFTWRPKTITPTDFSNMVFQSATKGWVLDISGNLHQTNDGGKTWTTKTAPTNALLRYNILDNELWTTGWTNNNKIAIYKSVDDGTNWTLADSSGTSALVELVPSSRDREVCWKLTQNGEFSMSRNGGTTWTVFASPTLNNIHFQHFAMSMSNLGADGIAVDTKNNYYMTSDSGKTWTVNTQGADPQVINTNAYGLSIANTTAAFMVNNGGRCMRTLNKGGNWESIYSNNRALYACYFNNTAKNGAVVGNSGRIAITSDSGATWVDKSVSTTNAFYDITFANQEYIAIGASGMIRKGLSQTQWTSVSSGTTQALRSISFPSANIGYIVGHGGVMLKSTNGGSNWQALTSPTTVNLIKVLFISDTEGIALGLNGTMFYTTNGGTSWSTIQTGVTEHFLNAAYIDNTWWITGNSGSLFSKPANGHFRTEGNFAYGNPINSIGFFDDYTGLATANGGYVLEYDYDCRFNNQPATSCTPAKNLTICIGDSTKLFAAGKGKLLWYQTNTSTNPIGEGSQFQTPSLQTSTTYYVLDSLCNAGSRIPIQVIVNGPKPSIFTAQDSRTLCRTSPSSSTRFIATATSGQVYWYNNWPSDEDLVFIGDTFGIPPVAGAGIYLFGARATDGACKSDIIPFVLTVIQRPIVTGFINDPVCSGQAAKLIVQGTGTVVSWYNDTTSEIAIYTGDTFITPALTSSITYYAKSIDNPCQSPFVYIPAIINPLPNVMVTKEPDSSLIVAQLNAQYQWYDCQTFLDVPSATGRRFMPTITGSYGVRVELDGCSDTSGCVSIQVLPIGLPEEANFKAEVYPIPATSNLSVTTAMKNVNLMLYDILGKMVMNQQLVDEQTILDLTMLTNGTYTLVLKSGESSYVRKVIITK